MGPSIQPAAHPSIRSRASGAYSPASTGMNSRMPMLSGPIPAVRLTSPNIPAPQPHVASPGASEAQAIYGTPNPLVPRLGMRLSRERRSERSARRRFWIAVMTVAVAIIAVCVALLIWLAQHPSGTLFVPGFRTTTAMVTSALVLLRDSGGAG